MRYEAPLHKRHHGKGEGGTEDRTMAGQLAASCRYLPLEQGMEKGSIGRVNYSKKISLCSCPE
ncbi:MAG: hypothetical protein A2Z14_12605 [Chloroflexi bacterium RBG_16_48_8]|nr:MAG: hypothetical protein A2Z14_12605 [Chloroflexi bacterium RBG_16_48_8]